MTWGEWQASNGKQTRTLRLWTPPTAPSRRAEPLSTSGQLRSLLNNNSIKETFTCLKFTNNTVQLRELTKQYESVTHTLLQPQQRNNGPLWALPGAAESGISQTLVPLFMQIIFLDLIINIRHVREMITFWNAQLNSYYLLNIRSDSWSCESTCGQQVRLWKYIVMVCTLCWNVPSFVSDFTLFLLMWVICSIQDKCISSCV